MSTTRHTSSAGEPTGSGEAGVETTFDDPVATLTFTNPAQRGALTPEMLVGLREHLRVLEQQGRRVVVVRGSGNSFSSGYAIDRFPGPSALAVKDEIELTCEAFESSPVVVIALLRGYAIGAALDLACACDFRFAEQSCRLGITPAKLGLVYTWRGTRRIERLVGRDHARFLFFTGDLVEGGMAAEMGLVTRVYDDAATLESETYRFGDHVAANAPLSLAGAKRIFYELDRAHDLPQTIDDEVHEMRKSAMASKDAAQAREAFSQRRKPDFGGPGDQSV